MIGWILGWLRRRAVKRLREGDEIVLWPACDVREDHLIVDLSRLAGEQLVGIKWRVWGTLRAVGDHKTPDYPEEVNYVKPDDLWKCVAYAKLKEPRLGSRVELWTGTHYEERLVVDMSRAAEGLVGIKRRRRNLGEGHATDFPDRVEYLRACDFEVANPDSRDGGGTV